MKSFDKAFQGQIKGLIGHNRAATRGLISENNAHPFIFKHVLGAHNGTLYQIAENKLKNRLKDPEQFETDSELVFANLEVYPDPKETISLLEGAWALVWYDSRTECINFIRNKERPLYYIFDGDRKNLVWASVPETIFLAAATNSFKFEKNADYKPKLMQQLPENTLVSFKVPYPNQKFNEEPDKRTHIEGFKPKFDTKVYGGYYYGTGGSEWTEEDFAVAGFSATETHSKTEYHSTGNYAAGSTGAAQSNLLSYLNPNKTFWNQFTKKYEWPTEQINSVWRLKQGWIRRHDKAGTAEEYVCRVNMAVDNTTTVITPTETKIETPLTKVETVTEKQLKTGMDLIKENSSIVSILVHQSANIKCYFDKETKNWDTYRWVRAREEWVKETTKVAPEDIPYNTLNWESGGDHNFVYKKRWLSDKGELVFYKGYNGILLSSRKFNDLMAGGCISCQRKDVLWGNQVTFVDKEGHFLCEHCSRDESLKTSLIEVGKEVAS